MRDGNLDLIPVDEISIDVRKLDLRDVLVDEIPVDVLVEEIPVDVREIAVREPIAGNLLRKQIKEHLTLPSKKERIEEIEIIQRLR